MLRSVCLFALFAAFTANFASAQQADAPAPPQRTFQSLECWPPQIQISSIRDARRFLITGITSDGQKIDVTAKATATAGSPCFTVSVDGYVNPVSVGQGNLLIEAAGLKMEVPVTVAAVDPVPVDFIREVNPLLSKSGCNQGTCHGSANGRNGFKLSLRGYDSSTTTARSSTTSPDAASTALNPPKA